MVLLNFFVFLVLVVGVLLVSGVPTATAIAVKNVNNYNDDDVPIIVCESFATPVTALSKKDSKNNAACPLMESIVATTIGRELNTVTYDQKVVYKKESSYYADFVSTKMEQIVLPRLGLCQADCTTDTDCAPGLYCSTSHSDELKKAKYSPIKANCGLYSTGDADDSVCFDPIVLYVAERFPKKLRSANNNNKQKQQQQQNRRQLCSGKCLTRCRNSNAPFCLALNCERLCDRRRRSLQLRSETGSGSGSSSSSSSSKEDHWNNQEASAEIKQRRLETLQNELTSTATNKLREMASTWTNITDPNCLLFLETAVCSVVPKK